MRKAHLNKLWGVLIALVLTFGADCSRQSSDTLDGDPFLKPRFTEELTVGLSPEHLAKYQPDVRMVAYWKNGMVEVRVKNHTEQKFNIGPNNFAVIAPRAGGGIASGKIVPVKPGETKSMFPRLTLEPDDEASGWFKFYNLGDLEGGFMVFNHPDPAIRPSRCLIGNKNELP